MLALVAECTNYYSIDFRIVSGEMIQVEDNNKVMIIYLSGKIDSNNSQDLYEEIIEKLNNIEHKDIAFDMEKVDYISSAGLRIFLNIRKSESNTDVNIRIINVNDAVYDVFEMTGFTNIFTIMRVPKSVSIEGLEEIGRGATGVVYRLSDESIIKVYNESWNLEAVYKEQQVSKIALINGIDTTISYNIVKAGNQFGIIYELLNATTFERVMLDSIENIKSNSIRFAQFVKQQHSIVVDEEYFASTKEQLISDTMCQSIYTDEEKALVVELINKLPDGDRFVHGDLNLANVMGQSDELILIDMGDATRGIPEFDIAWIYLMYVYRLSFKCKDVGSKLMPQEFWDTFIREYYADFSEEKIKKYENMFSVLGEIKAITFSSKIPISGLFEDMKDDLIKRIGSNQFSWEFE